jgi:hypothetical protein
LWWRDKGRTCEPCQEPDPAFAVFRSSVLCVVGRGFGFPLGVARGAVEQGMGCLEGVYEERDVGWALRVGRSDYGKKAWSAIHRWEGLYKIHAHGIQRGTYKRIHILYVPLERDHHMPPLPCELFRWRRHPRRELVVVEQEHASSYGRYGLGGRREKRVPHDRGGWESG